MNRKLQSIIILFIMIVAMTKISYGESTISYLTPYPKDINMYIDKPDIGIKLELNGNDIESIEMKLDGQIVNAKYDANLQTIAYRPFNALTAGKHTVDLIVRIKAWSNFLNESWNFTVDSKAISSFPAISDEQKYVLDFANNLRKTLNISSLSVSDSLNAAAKAHTKYMVSNQKTTHDELPGNQEYTGGTPLVRAEAYGYNGVVVEENVSSGHIKMEDALKVFIDAPYHRLNWINPYVDHIGASSQDRYYTVLFGTKTLGEDLIVTYPYNTQTDVPITWRNRESPNPLAGNYDTSTGYPITVSYFSGKTIEAFDLTSTLLKDNLGETVYTYVKHPRNDENLKDSIIIIPKNPLKENTKYSLQVKFAVLLNDGRKESVDKTITFTTVNNRIYAYKDIEKHWAGDIIDQLSQKRISMTTQSYFYPDKDITRGEFSKLVSDMLDLTKYALKGTFSDVTEDTAFAKEIEAAARRGYIKGYENGSFKPSSNISRQEIAVILKRVYDEKVTRKYDISNYVLPFNDKEAIPSWSEESVKLCSKIGIIKGRESGEFGPFDSTTRAEAYVIISRMINAMK